MFLELNRNADTFPPIIEQYYIFAQIRKYIQICGGPLAKYEHFLKVIFIYKLIIQYILWIRHSGSDVNRLNFNRLLIAINRSNRLINRLRILND